LLRSIDAEYVLNKGGKIRIKKRHQIQHVTGIKALTGIKTGITGINSHPTLTQFDSLAAQDEADTASTAHRRRSDQVGLYSLGTAP
jgi:hypothetical protein